MRSQLCVAFEFCAATCAHNCDTRQSCRLVTIETLITIFTIENLNSWQSLFPDNQEWHWTAFAILAMFSCYKMLAFPFLMQEQLITFYFCKIHGWSILNQSFANFIMGDTIVDAKKVLDNVESSTWKFRSIICRKLSFKNTYVVCESIINRLLNLINR